MNKYPDKNGWIRAMYPPAKDGLYLVKIGSDEYELSFYKNLEWDVRGIIAWLDFPKTDFDTPF